MTMLQRQVVFLAEMRARGGTMTGREVAALLRSMGLTRGQGQTTVRRAVRWGHLTKHEGGHDGSRRHYRIVEGPA
ncbi:MAG: hypothetical protein AAF602_22990 [Myxococcota bacterium]